MTSGLSSSVQLHRISYFRIGVSVAERDKMETFGFKRKEVTWERRNITQCDTS
jgi:hypothetical protein